MAAAAGQSRWTRLLLLLALHQLVGGWFHRSRLSVRAAKEAEQIDCGGGGGGGANCSASRANSAANPAGALARVEAEGQLGRGGHGSERPWM